MFVLLHVFLDCFLDSCEFLWTLWSLWTVVDSFGPLWIVLRRFGLLWIVVGHCVLLWMVVDHCGLLRVIPCFSKHENMTSLSLSVISTEDVLNTSKAIQERVTF